MSTSVVARPRTATGPPTTAPDAHAAPRLNRRLGIVAIIVSATAMGAAGLFGRLASPPGAPLGEFLTLGRMLVGALGMLVIVASARRIRDLVRVPLSLPIVLGGVLLGISLATYLSATLLIDLSLAVALHYTGPVVSVGLAWLLLGERPSRADTWSLALSFAGMMLVAGLVGGSPPAMSGDAALGVVLALVSGVSYGGALLTYRYRPDMPSDVRSLWNFSFGALAVGVMVALDPPKLDTMTPANWAWAGAFFVVAGFVALGLLVVAGKHLRSIELSGLSYTEVVVAALIGTAAFGEPFGAAAVVGTVLIAWGALLPLAGARTPASGTVRRALARAARTAVRAARATVRTAQAMARRVSRVATRNATRGGAMKHRPDRSGPATPWAAGPPRLGDPHTASA